MVQGGGGASFAASAQGLRIPVEVLGEKFYEPRGGEIEVFGSVDYSHAAAANLFEDAIVGERFAVMGRIVAARNDRGSG